jgi:hypothetical protein
VISWPEAQSDTGRNRDIRQVEHWPHPQVDEVDYETASPYVQEISRRAT